MLTIHQIARRVDGFRRAGSKFVKFTDLKKGYLSNGNGYIAGASYSTHVLDSSGRAHVNEDPSKYVTVIEFVDSELHVHVSCSCSDFTYRWEWALWNRGASEIEYSNGDAPDTTNPMYKPKMCKHSFALYLKIKDKIPPPTPVTPNKKKEVEKNTRKRK
jgi:hypothetical protein